ncbi:MAG: ABC transporter ATP-binding protein [Eubacteriales bacterium]|nr:ABC transporter ATP-binding protein [Christensenellaceae bacterium]MEA5067315.1 ABC transporter ATP-binding protein [Eubacteriales bacterium]
MSVSIKIEHALKRYGQATIIPDLSLNIDNGELFTLLGPSGCGKTTLLRMIAGFNSIEGGDFYFDALRINDLDPGKRNIGMVFQNYAIFPHLSVRKNVAFGLKNRGIRVDEVKARTDEFLKLTRIEQYAERMPDRLSGGQQQRVALARALVIRPDVLLMDEPLSNLDAKLRVEMRAVIRRIQRGVGITTVYVTHDQEEAMAISDRIAVMNNGVIQHIGAPKHIYQRPANLFVATFIGKSNVFKGRTRVVGGARFVELAGGCRVAADSLRADYALEEDVLVSIRPEELMLCGPENAEGHLRATIDDSVFLGLNTHYFVTLESGEPAEIIQESQIDSILPPGSKIALKVNTEKFNVFSAKGELSLMAGVHSGLEGRA